MKIRILLIALLVSSFSWGQSIFNNPIAGTNPNTSNPFTTGQTVAANMTASGIGRGTGIAGSNANDRYNASGWSTGAIDLTDYFEFTMTPSPGFEINFVSFVYTGQVSSGTPSFAFRSSVDGYASNIGTPTATGTTISLSASTYQNVNTAITFRFYAFGLPAAGTTFSINDFTFNGTVVTTTPCTTPTTQASALSSNSVTTTGANLSWTDGASTSGSLVSLRLAGAPTAPTSSTNYVPTLNFATAAGANLISAGNVVVAKSNAGTVTGITGLTAGTQYTATPYAYNGSGTNVCFNTSNPESFNFWTLANEPASYASFTTCGTTTATSIVVNFAAASTISANGYVILYRQGATPTGTPVDGTIYGALTSIGDSTVGAYVNSSIATSATINSLNGGSSYTFILVPFNVVTGPVFATINYRTLATIPTLTCSTSPAPEINIRGIVGTNPTITDGDVTPSGLDNTLFATVVVASNQSKIFRIENTGNTNLNVNSITMVGGNNTEFVVSGITLPTIIAGGGFLDFTVTFTPTAAGTRNTTLTIASNDANEATYDFLIQGTGTATPIVEINVRGNGLSIADNSIYPQGTNWTAFPVTLQGGSSTRIFTIENLGSTVLSLTGASPYIQITGANASQFSVSIIPSNAIVGGGSTTFQITFSPTSGGTKNATILIFSNDSDENPYNFNIRGTCQGSNNIYVTGNGNDVPKGSVTTAATNLTNFGLIPVTTGLKQNTFVITNLAGSTTYLSTVSISGADAAMFTVVSQPNNGAFGSGNTTSFTINFTPTSAGVKNATVTFNVFTNSARTSPDPLDPIFTFAISGEGIVYTPCTNNAVQIIAQQDFEVAPAAPVWTYNSPPSDGTVNLAGGTFNNGSGAVNAFVGARSFQFRGIGTTTTRSAVMTLNAVDVSQYNNINFSMRVGAYRFSGTTQGLDVNDLVQVETSIDGGVNWSVESVLRGFTNSRWSFAATGIFNAYYTGNNSGVSLDTRNGNAELTGAAGISTYFVRNLPQVTNLLIRITLNVDRDDELWAIDDIKIEGQTRQSTTWDGTTWSAGFPTSSTKAIFDGNYTTTSAVDNGSVQACECQINSGRNVTIDSGYYFDIQSNITNSGTLTIANNGSLIQVNDTATNTGNIIYQRTATGIRGFDYVYWSSPVSGQSVDNIYSSPIPGLKYKWNPLATNINSPLSSGRWEASSGTMDVGTGYIVRGSSNFNMPSTNIPAVFTGPVNNGIIPVNIGRGSNTTPSTVGSGNGVTFTNFDDNWNLVGNPYPSAIRTLDFLNANTNIQGFIYLWTHNTAPISSINPFYSSFIYNYTSSDYITYNGTATTTGPIGPPTFNGNIAGGQGFFVLMNDGATGNGTVNFRNSMRSSAYANNQFYRNSQNGEEDKHRIWLDLLDSNTIPVRTVIGYVPEATNGLDRLYDAQKNTANDRTIYSIVDNETQIIQGRSLPFNTNDTVQIGVRIMQDGEYKIAIGAVDGLFSEPTQNIYIEDKLLGIIHDLRQNPYSFTTLAEIFNDRFVLRYERNVLSNPDLETTNDVILTTNQGIISVNSSFEMIQEISVFDILGRHLFEAKSIGRKDFSSSKFSIRKQALIVKIKLENGTIVTRKIIL
jgi:hypothetical protein